jgi:large subunit ribosomal protein L30
MKQIAAIRVRGAHNVQYEVRKTLEMLHLYKSHFCSVIPATPANLGMITRAKDYITWGTIDDTTLKTLYEKRGEPYKGDAKKKGAYFVVGDKKLKKFFRLSPPVGGFERKGVKKPYTVGGVLGDRKGHINELLKKMM